MHNFTAVEIMSHLKIKIKIKNKLRFEELHPPDPAEIERLKGKYRLWQKLTGGKGINCAHCIFGLKNVASCKQANQYYDDLLEQGYYCLAFLRKGNYVK
jgi:hypothetical protein